MSDRLPSIVVLDGHTLNPGDNPWDDLARLGRLEIHERSDPEAIVSRARDADILVINKVPLTDSVLEQLPRLRFVTVTATGYDCVDVAAARRRGVVVSNIPVYGTASVAQLTIAHILHLCHRIDLHDQAVRESEWERSGQFSFWKIPLVELDGKTLGIIGLGRIGRQVARLASSFGMSVVAASRTRGPAPIDGPFAWAEVDEVFRRADVLTLHCPLTPETAGLVNSERLQSMKRSALLINVSRGGLVVEEALARALNESWIAGAGVDVVSIEPIRPDNPLLTARNCFITPHLAWATLEARRRLMQATVQNVAAFLAGNPQNVVSG